MLMRPISFVLLMGLVLAGAIHADAQEPKTLPEMPPRIALPSDTGQYRGYHVGGGAGNPRKAEPRRADEGTWGWDYQGLLPRRIILGWWHGRRVQGGTGAYKTDGPRLYDK